MHHHCSKAHAWYAMQDGHRGGFGRGPHRRRRGGPGGPGGYRIGKMLGDGDLKLIVLALLEESPRHGYDVIRALEERSSGVYTPSPGVVYPTLTFLEEAGYASPSQDGTRKVYAMTREGTAYLEENRDAAEAILDQITEIGRRLARAKAWSDWSEGSPETPTLKTLDKARRRLRALIADAMEGDEDEQERLAEILNRAADEALGKTRN